jgi:sterol-4alpha-carboxylate 3-dehydrogenase (decarboxylating)
MDPEQSLGSVLVVGGCGFLGHQIVKRLLETDICTDISVLDIRTDRNRLLNVTYFDGDICSESAVLSVFDRVRAQVVFHTASPPALSRDLGFYIKVNVGGTRNLLECVRAVKTVRAFVYTSSASVVHDSVSDMTDIDESAPLLYMPVQREPYSHTKALADSLVLAANRQDGTMLTASIRPSGLFGEGDPTTVKPMVEAAASGKYRYQIGDGKNLFDWTYIGNVAHAHILSAQALLKAHNNLTTANPVASETKIDGEAFLVTNGAPMPFWEFARALGAAAGYPTDTKKIRVIPRIVGLTIGTVAEWLVWITSFGRKKSRITRSSMKFSTMTRTFRIDKAKRRLGYRPLVSMEEGIRRAGESFAKDARKIK